MIAADGTHYFELFNPHEHGLGQGQGHGMTSSASLGYLPPHGHSAAAMGAEQYGYGGDDGTNSAYDDGNSMSG